jgi:hypothetical protein
VEGQDSPLKVGQMPCFSSLTLGDSHGDRKVAQEWLGAWGLGLGASR